MSPAIGRDLSCRALQNSPTKGEQRGRLKGVQKGCDAIGRRMLMVDGVLPTRVGCCVGEIASCAFWILSSGSMENFSVHNGENCRSA